MSDPAGADRLDIRIVGGNPTDEEVAAVTAVLDAALEELAGEERRRPGAGPTAWQRSQRNVRHPLVRGAWREHGL
ncbi:MAG TPA: acyl-CoA carboxylase subunit epsilon [Pseudolysinimonas sp.]|nr:acyl-CoA carboxylase subunit epsilon [Pseudolysinimonas sp.]